MGSCLSKHDNKTRVVVDMTSMSTPGPSKVPSSETLDDLEAEDMSTLNDILQESNKYKSFLQYLRVAYEEETCDKIGAKNHQNCLTFLLDTSDFASLQAPELKRLLAQDIFDTYLNPHSRRSLNVTSSECREVSKILEREEEIPHDLFSALENEALASLEEAFQAFSRSQSKYGLRSCIKLRRTSSGLSMPLNLPEDVQFVAQETKLRSIIKKPNTCRVFREYQVDRDAEDALNFVIDVLDYHDAFDYVQQSASAEDIASPTNNCYVIKTASKIYRTHFRLGVIQQLKIRSRIAQEIKADLQRDAVGREIFDSAMLVVVNMLITEHFSGFLSSKEFQQHNVKLQEHMARKNRNSSKQSQQAIPSFPKILSGHGVTYFQEYLRLEDRENELLFWTAVEEIKTIPYIQKQFIERKANKIFTKFIRRGALMEIDLPMPIRQSIVANISSANEHIFDQAQAEIYCVLEEMYMDFSHDSLFEDMMENWQAAVVDSKLHQAAALRQMIDFRDILMNPKWLSEFRKFVHAEGCAQPLFFWLEVENYRALPKSDYLMAQAKKLYSKHIDTSETNHEFLEPATIETIKHNLQFPSPILFLQAQEECYRFMLDKVYPKFRRSNFFRNLDPSDTVTVSVSTTSHGEIEQSKVFDDLELQSVPNILSKPESRKLFLAFCEASHCQENVYFWIDSEEYRYIPSDDFARVAANKIYRKYVMKKAKAQVNLPSRIVAQIESTINTPTRHMFLEAQKEIEKLMKTDSLPKFRQSKEFRQYQQHTDARAGRNLFTFRSLR